jgi:hypothetical protein
MELYGNNANANANRPAWARNDHFGLDRQVATYVRELAPEITAWCKSHNDGDGLNGEDSILLADLLQKEIEGGGAIKYAVEELDLYELCFDCNATGRAGAYPPHDSIVCDKCNGEAWVPSAEKCELFVSSLRQFAKFLRGCGGFRFKSQHEPDLRNLHRQWGASCESAREEFQSTLPAMVNFKQRLTKLEDELKELRCSSASLNRQLSTAS